MEKLKKKVTIVLMAIMMTMVFFADAQAKAGCNHKHTGRTWIIAEKANCNHTGRKKQLCVRCRKVLLEKVISKTKHKWKLTRKRRTRYDCLKCGGVKLKNLCYWYLCQESVYRQNQNVIIKISHG